MSTPVHFVKTYHEVKSNYGERVNRQEGDRAYFSATPPEPHAEIRFVDWLSTGVAEVTWSIDDRKLVQQKIEG